MRCKIRFHTFILAMALLVLIMPIVDATTLHGTIYDMELNQVNNALVEIDTEPPQRFLAKNGTYSFEVPKGEFDLRVTYSIDDLNNTHVEKVAVKQEGIYVFDIFLFPEMSEEEELLANAELNLMEEEKEPLNIFWMGLVLFIAVSVLLIGRKLVAAARRTTTNQEMKQEIHDDYDKLIINFLKKNGGRTTQKELRKEIPLSEAKISLLITELEQKGIVQKIKKGRGNIIILKK